MTICARNTCIITSFEPTARFEIGKKNPNKYKTTKIRNALKKATGFTVLSHLLIGSVTNRELRLGKPPCAF